MACESDKCEKYGLHHDYKDGFGIRKCFACGGDEKSEPNVCIVDNYDLEKAHEEDTKLCE